MIVSESHPTSAVGSYKGYLSDINPTPNLDLISQKSSYLRMPSVQMQFLVLARQ